MEVESATSSSADSTSKIPESPKSALSKSVDSPSNGSTLAAPMLDMHGANNGDSVIDDNNSDQQECLEDMPVLTVEVDPDDDDSKDFSLPLLAEHELPSVTDDENSKLEAPTSGNNVTGTGSDSSFQRSYEADVDESMDTRPGDIEEDSNLDAMPNLADSSGDTSVDASQDFRASDNSPLLNEESSQPPDIVNTKEQRRKPRKPRSELDRLLMDEGTVRILLGQKKANESGSGSRREKLSELEKKRDLAINQVRDSSRARLFEKVSLRDKTRTKRLEAETKRKGGKKSKVETAASTSTSTAEPSSKIIRRRSSSCSFNFSSRSPSPLPMSGFASAAPLQTTPQDLIQVRTANGIGHICLSSEAVFFNTQIASRLNSILNSCKIDDTITVVEITTTSDFIQGLDIEAIRGETDDGLRESMADSMAACLDTLLRTLLHYPKLLVAGIKGDALDFGVIILSYFDVVYAADKATFRANYGGNGYMPESLQFFPKNRLAHSMLYTGRKLSASEAVTAGLVSEILPHGKFTDELSKRVKSIAVSNKEVLLEMKEDLNKKKSNKLELTRDLRSWWLKF